MAPDIWEILVNAIASIQACPSWLKEQASLTWEAVSRLPVVDTTSNGQHALPTVQEKVVTPDYLNFLREQIGLNARGPKWSAVLKNRLAALEPFVGKPLMMVTFHCLPHIAMLRIRPDAKEVIHVEIN